MLQELRVKNFLSFREEAVLSFEATDEQSESGVVEVATGVRLLRCAALMGANASGKSNLLNAFDFLARFWRRTPSSSSAPIDVVPFLLDDNSRHAPSCFTITFFAEGIKYAYTLEVTPEKVVREQLDIYRTQRPSLLILRTWEEGRAVIAYGSSARVPQAVRKEIELKCLPNMSYLAAKNQVNASLPDIDAATRWLQRSLPQGVYPRTDMDDFAADHLQRDHEERLKAYLLQFLATADFNISDVRVRQGEVSVPENDVQFCLSHWQLSAGQRAQLEQRHTLSYNELQFQHCITNEQGGACFLLPVQRQSAGTLRTLGLETLLFEALEQQQCIHVDELDASLHPDLVELLLRCFLQTDSHAQLLFTTHYDNLLAMAGGLLRKDMFWFTEKGSDGGSNLYALVEFNGLGRLHSLPKAYRMGRFGAIPDIKE